MMEIEDFLEKLSFLIRLSLCRSSMPHLPFRLFVVEARHQPSQELIFA